MDSYVKITLEQKKDYADLSIVLRADYNFRAPALRRIMKAMAPLDNADIT